MSVRVAVHLERLGLISWARYLRLVVNPKGVDHLDDGVIVPPSIVTKVMLPSAVWERTGGKTWRITFHRRPHRVAVPAEFPVGWAERIA